MRFFIGVLMGVVIYNTCSTTTPRVIVNVLGETSWEYTSKTHSPR